ncbi:hypothetical protein M8A51_23095 [Schlegelella sp. S2-27]|uniref:Uncharacterized protein n=1 Tax=Caldimonas mangrovi TaxID=2944811 RepID=A0ABT0YUK1_9BURK|nr:hypothetical protein [Caldimonas mangrovi]MCM5682425.1 hypothetical protein [Caldimonas mangrovi]
MQEPYSRTLPTVMIPLPPSIEEAEGVIDPLSPTLLPAAFNELAACLRPGLEQMRIDAGVEPQDLHWFLPNTWLARKTLECTAGMTPEQPQWLLPLWQPRGFGLLTGKPKPQGDVECIGREPNAQYLERLATGVEAFREAAHRWRIGMAVILADHDSLAFIHETVTRGEPYSNVTWSRLLVERRAEARFAPEPGSNPWLVSVPVAV